MTREPSEKEIAEIKEFIFAGKKIHAIKWYREATRCDLKHAKDVVEDLQQRLWQESPEEFSSPPGHSASGLLVIFVLVAIGMAIWGLVHWIAAPQPH